MRGLDILAGQLAGLADAGIRPDAICGTSAGAIIAALAAAGHTPQAICDIIGGLRDRDVRQERWFWKPRALWIDHFLEHKPIRKLLHKLLPADISNLKIPYSCATTETHTGGLAVWSSAPAALPGRRMSIAADWRDCVLASMSISGVFSWVGIGGAEYADGGVRAGLPLPDTWTAYDQVALLVASYSPNYRGRKRSIISRLLLNAEWYSLDQVLDVLSRIARRRQSGACPDVQVIYPPPLEDAGGLLRFDHSLIAKAQKTAYERVLKAV